MEKEFPILEYDNTEKALIDPFKQKKKQDIPKIGVITFFNDVVKNLLSKGLIRQTAALNNEIGEQPVYEFNQDKKNQTNQRVLLFHPGIGAALSASQLDLLIGLGLKHVIVCGGAGVLNGDLELGKIIIPIKAVRDEGLSYHYLAPSRYSEPSEHAVKTIETILKNHDVPYIKGTTWTTDAPLRETKAKIKLRREIDKCLTVEMEASAFFAVAKFRKILLGQILYAGDDISGHEWELRDWTNVKSVREQLVWLAKEAVEEMYANNQDPLKEKN